MKTVGVNQPHVASDELSRNALVVDGSQTCVDESAPSTGTAGGSVGNSVSTLEASESDASFPAPSESVSSESVKDEAMADERNVVDEILSRGVETVSTGVEAVAAGAEPATDESIISTADLRDVFNRLEVIVQKLARGGAVW